MGAQNNDQINGSLYGLLSPLNDTEKARVRGAIGTSRNYAFHKAAVDAAASTTSNVVIAKVGARLKVTSVEVLPAATLTADATNNATITLEAVDGLGGAGVVIATATTTAGGTGNWTALTKVPLTLTPANVVVEGETFPKYLTLRIAKGGTGVTVPVATVFVGTELC